jgi:hypothetical protein
VGEVVVVGEATVVGALVVGALVGGTVFVVEGVLRGATGAWEDMVGITVATASPRMAKARSPSAESEDSNTDHAAVSGNLARAPSGGGVTSSSPRPRRTVLTNRPWDTDAMEGAPEEIATLRVGRPQAVRASAKTSVVPMPGTSVRARGGILRTRRTGHSLVHDGSECAPDGHDEAPDEEPDEAGSVQAVGGSRKLLKRLVAAAGVAGTIASIWWFALRPRRKRT